MRGGTQWAPPLMLLRVRTQRRPSRRRPLGSERREPWLSLFLPRARLELVEAGAQFLEESGRSREVFLDAREVGMR